MFLSHGAAGFTTAYLTRKVWEKKDYSDLEKSLLYSSSIITGVLPDFDLAYAFFNGGSHHHDYITHRPILYIAIAIILLGFTFFIKSRRRKLLLSFIFIMLMTTLTHLIFDAFAGHVKLFYPFSDKMIAVMEVSPFIETDNLVLQLLTTPFYFALEILFLVASILILSNKLKKNKQVFILPSITLVFISIIASSLTFLLIMFI
ncbi:metal-dependent hydrolase [Candidatus Dojkabacteria bacterium]|nr:metal-dependent hydrolase [Candidatus Dojkabacteria bacterium]